MSTRAARAALVRSIPMRFLRPTAILVLAAGAATAHAAAATHTVTIEGTAFVPAVTSVSRGDRVTWVNKDPFPHTVAATDGTFASRTIAAGKSWTYVAARSGQHDYACTLHPSMQGRLEVR